MPTFQSSLVPKPLVRPVSAPVSAAPAPLAQSSGEALTLDALMARQKQAAQQQATNMESPVTNIPQGLGQLAWTFVNGLKERRAERDIAQGNADVANAFKQVDWNTGQLPDDAMATLMQRNPDLGIDMYKTAMTLRAQQAKQENWVAIPTPEGENGQWFKNTVNNETKKIGGGADTGAWKPSDIAARADDYTKLASVYDAAAPSWQSMQDAAKMAIGKTGAEVGAADYNMVVGLAKILDPGSVVRQGETETIVETGGAADYLIAYVNKLKQAGSLSDDIRRGIMATGQSRMKAYYDQAKSKRDWISGVATRHGVDPNDVVPPLAEFQGYQEAPPEDDPTNPAPEDVTEVPDDGTGSIDGVPTKEAEGTEATSNGKNYIVKAGKWTLIRNAGQ